MDDYEQWMQFRLIKDKKEPKKILYTSIKATLLEQLSGDNVDKKQFISFSKFNLQSIRVATA